MKLFTCYCVSGPELISFVLGLSISVWSDMSWLQILMKIKTLLYGRDFLHHFPIFPIEREKEKQRWKVTIFTLNVWTDMSEKTVQTISNWS